MTKSTPSSQRLPLATTTALIEQFIANLSPDSVHTNDNKEATNGPSPLLLLSASATTLKAQVTKLSLLTVTTPFTPSAVATCVQPLNESILTSLITAAQMTLPGQYTAAFQAECHSLCRALLRELLSLVKLVQNRSKDGQPTKELSEPRKKEITEATGRVWELCDETVLFAENGLPHFIAKKANQWLELMKDAVKELSEWDPEEEIDENDIFGDAQSDDEDSSEAAEEPDSNPSDRATISAGVRDQALKVLNRIPQSVHVVVKQRLEKLKIYKGEVSPETRSTLDLVLSRIKRVSELIDESAEGMYLGNLELCLKMAGEARAETIEIVQNVLRPFTESREDSNDLEIPENNYIARALEWIKQVDAGSFHEGRKVS
jgi:hypothetical protein